MIVARPKGEAPFRGEWRHVVVPEVGVHAGGDRKISSARGRHETPGHLLWFHGAKSLRCSNFKIWPIEFVQNDFGISNSEEGFRFGEGENANRWRAYAIERDSGLHWGVKGEEGSEVGQ